MKRRNVLFFFFSSRRRHTRWPRDWSSDVCSSDLSGPGAPSPTGRNPRLLWTPQQQAVWEQMVDQNNPWWKLIQHNAKHTPFADRGAWATLAYQMTGDPT